jgi:hypothetical protein
MTEIVHGDLSCVLLIVSAPQSNPKDSGQGGQADCCPQQRLLRELGL